MNEENSTSTPRIPMLWAFLAGAAAGALVVAFTTPKTGPELRGDVGKWTRYARKRARHMANGAGEAWDEAKLRAGLAAVDIKDGFGSAAQDLRGVKAPGADAGGV